MQGRRLAGYLIDSGPKDIQKNSNAKSDQIDSLFKLKKAGSPASKDNSQTFLFQLALAARAEQRRLLGAYDRVILGVLIDLKPWQIFFGYRHVRENSFDRTFGDAGIAIDTGIGVYQEPVGQFVKGFDGANRGTIGVFTFDTGLSNNVGHKIDSGSRLAAAAFLGFTPEYRGDIEKILSQRTRPAEAGTQNSATPNVKP